MVPSGLTLWSLARFHHDITGVCGCASWRSRLGGAAGNVEDGWLKDTEKLIETDFENQQTKGLGE